MKTRTIEEWRITELLIELEKRVERYRLEITDSAARNADNGYIRMQTGRWYEAGDALALVRSFLEESEDIEACKERLKNG